MIFADKLISLRKKCGWSQEELAEKMNVTRQSVSKWEGAQSVPDLNKILQLSELFGVSTDYLLKDEIEETEYIDAADEEKLVRRISMEDANEFLETKCKTAKFTALATFLCIFSVIPLIFLGGYAEYVNGMSEDAAGGLGMIIMLILVAAAVVIFIVTESKVSQFEFLEKEIFETEYGVSGMVKERKNNYKDTYTKYNVIGVVFCILAVVPLFFGAFIVGEDSNARSEMFLILMLCLMLLMIAAGVVFFILGGIPWASFQKLLQEGDYSRTKKRNASFNGKISSIYWLLTVAIFLTFSFCTNNWKESWIIWPVAGVLFAALMVGCSIYRNNKE